MSEMSGKSTSRRDFLKHTGKIAAASALAAGIVPKVYAAENNTIKLALIGCGGRGSGAANDAMSVNKGPVKLVAMADVFEHRLKGSYENLKRAQPDLVDVPEDRKFVGFDAYKQAMDCLSPGDIAIFGSPPAFRWVHFTYAIKKGLNVFMEKPVTVDGPTSRRMFKLGEESVAKNLKVGVGLMSRHSRALEQLQNRIADGEIGEIVLQRAYRMHGVGFAQTGKPAGISHLMYQIQRFHSFLWASGGTYSDYYIHLVDHQTWMKNDWPIKAQALGGRHYKTNAQGVPFVDQNFDTYSVEHTYRDGSKFYLDGRCMTGCPEIFSSYAHGTKGSAVVSAKGDCGMPSRIFKGQSMTPENMTWESRVSRELGNPYQNEWNDLVDAIRSNTPFNETENGVKASLVASMGRMAAHTGQEITYDQILNSDHEMAPGLDKLTADSPAPLQPGPDGKYPMPQPGITKTREY